MNGLDWFLLAMTVAAAVGGYRLGFVTRVTSWSGMLAGIALGATLLPAIVDGATGRLNRSDLVVVAVAVIIGAGLLGRAAGLFVGARLHVANPEGRARRIDAFIRPP